MAAQRLVPAEADFEGSLVHLPLVLAVLSVLGWWVVVHESIWTMAKIWFSSDTYLHCTLAAPIAALILVNRRRRYDPKVVSMSWMGLGLAMLTYLIYRAASLSGFQTAQHFAVLALPACLVMAFLGREITRRFAAVFVMLMMAWPVGEELVPLLIHVTASFIDALLDVLEIPAFREGAFIHLSSGVFHVAEACSGTRYLLATLFFAVVYSYLYLQNAALRVLFSAAAVGLAVVANGVRAAVIVLIAHFSEMQLAMGIDHIIYGWIFYACLLLVLVSIGRRLSRLDLTAGSSSAADVATQPASKVGSAQHLRALGIFAFVLLVPMSLVRNGGDFRSSAVSVALPDSVGGWSLQSSQSPTDFRHWHPPVPNGGGVAAGTYVRVGLDPLEVRVSVYRPGGHEADVISSRYAIRRDDSAHVRQRRIHWLDGVKFESVAVNTVVQSGVETSNVSWYAINGWRTGILAAAKVAQFAVAATGTRARVDFVSISTAPSASAELSLAPLIEEGILYRTTD